MCQMFSLLLHNKYYKLLQCLPVDYAPILGKSNYFLSLPHKLMKSSLGKKIKKTFCSISFFLCPHLLLCDGRSVIMRSGFFTRKTSVGSLYFLMYFPPLSLKRPMVFTVSGCGAWKKKKKKKKKANQCWWDHCRGGGGVLHLHIQKTQTQTHWKTANFLLSWKAADRWKKTYTYYQKKKKKNPHPLPIMCLFRLWWKYFRFYLHSPPFKKKRKEIEKSEAVLYFEDCE